MNDLIHAIEATPLSHFMNFSWWAWPTAESLHFVGLTLLMGTVGLFDLRLLGFLKGVAPAELHRLVPWGLGGFALSITTGILFFFGIPGMYLRNPAFWWKLTFLVLAGVNVLVFYLAVSPRVQRVRAGETVPPLARVIGGVSLALWIAVLCAGRLIAFYKP